MLRFITAGESHGKSLVAILDGMVANLPISEDEINIELQRRQQGYGRGDRMKIEADKAEIISGIRNGKTIGSPVSILIPNRSRDFFDTAFTTPRPGHADFAGANKYNQKDLRNILERASARETAARSAIGAICKKFLSIFNINVESSIIHIGGQKNFKSAIDKAKQAGDTVGGVFEIKVLNCPPGLGSYSQWDKRLSARLAQVIMSIPAIKGIEIGLGFDQAKLYGSEVHDEIIIKNGKISHKTNNAGGLEGGMTNGEPIVLRAAMKPISTLMKPLKSVDLKTKKPAFAHIERSDVCAVEAAAVVGEAMAAFEISNAMIEKFGGDSLEEIKANFTYYQKHISMV
ncbi:MAG: aroC [Candidatus Saganbacteria bacterium]|uniref:Chorismate synthase n=1 Tax=Candidatus Saganbacteria bacterium TaxID=2575572 RepID=A0A833L1M0_UNCSA|nr:MAG: aroC [Candidatus Saganbacteria bacterium]